MATILGLAIVIGMVVLAVILYALSLLSKRTNQHRLDIERLTSDLADLKRQLLAETVQPAPVPEAPEVAAPADDGAAPMALAAAIADGPIQAPVAAFEDTAAGSAAAAPPKPVERPLVLTNDLIDRLIVFVQKNWVFVISAVSLALAGIFLVQYGIETGRLTPPLRVTGALVLGAGLVAWGERLRRQGRRQVALHLPATFSGAGLVVVFAAILAARQMYGLIGPAPTLVGLVVTGLMSVVLGWYHGAFLITLGLLGAAAAPFLTGGGGTAPAWFYFYYALIAGIGLAVDSIRRWAWVSALALALAVLGGLAAHAFGAGEAGWTLQLIMLPILASTIPERSLIPRQQGPAIAELRSLSALPPFPVRLVAGTLLVVSVLMLLQTTAAAGAAMLALLALAFLVLALALWASAAAGLADLALVPAMAFVAALALAPTLGAPLAQSFLAQPIRLRPPESAAPTSVTLIMLMLAAMLGAAGLRSLVPGPLSRAQAVAAMILTGLALAILEFFWTPAQVIGAFPWALMLIGMAGVMVGFAVTFARRDGADHHRTATTVLIALALIGLAISILTAGTPLTLAISLLVVVAAWLDRRFDLAEMAIFLQVGVAVLTWRIVVDPGVVMSWALPRGDFLAGFGAPIVAGAISLWLVPPRGRLVVRVVLESAVMLWIVGFLDAALLRWLPPSGDMPLYLFASLMSLPWIGAMLTQAHRAGRIVPLRRLRQGLAVGAGLLGLGLLGLAVLVLNPLMFADQIIGPMVADSLALAYLMPGLLLMAAGRWQIGLWHPARLGGMGLGAALALMYLGLEIRRFWWGDYIAFDLGVKQSELYTYTLVMMLIGAGLLMAALTRHSVLLRRLAMAGIAVTIAKVFLLDAAGLTGLTRVLSFLGLGLSLAGLAWLNSLVEGATRPAGAAKAVPSGPVDPPAAP